ncbi:hypothetical protein GCM10019059_36110 [Camelimonas fluminis]|uniref:Uncharacterized protein n=1 Tax=Camelimonas fluminis TaxID=1576911 RepID=A0ABV7UGY8_9HYPH|nr:hypothetical protein [Camelimonas fluminis]GHE73293.1 hypothetical protein GCM10019059_36110 [Camelimonas fluminis]
MMRSVAPVEPVKGGIDVICRENGRFFLLMWGEPVSLVDYEDAVLYLDIGRSELGLYFYHPATEKDFRRKVVLVETQVPENINGFMTAALVGQRLVDVVLIDSRYTLENLRVEGIQNFMATCRLVL